MKAKIIIVLFLFSLLFNLDLDAQCSMCKAVVESGMEPENKVIIGNGINKGIYILMVIPYILLSILFYNLYKVRKAEKQHA